MLHLYAIAEDPVRLPATTGIDESTLSAATVDGIAAVLSTAASAPAETTEAAILAHARVVEEVAALNDAVLPARFGGSYEDESALGAAIRQRAPQLREALERVRGCVELGVRVARQRESGDQPPSSGGEYMRGRLAQVRSAERIAGALDDAVRRLVRDGTRRLLAGPELLVSAAYLLPRANVEPFRAAVAGVAETHPDLGIVCTGAWPPYSFALVDGATT
jgi:hypothetical protein